MALNRGMRGFAAAAALLGAALAAGAPEALADAYKDEKLGFAFVAPSKWDPLPLAKEDWVVAKFNCDREYEYADPKTNQWAWLRPNLDVVIIPKSAAEDRGATVEKTEKGVKIHRSAPWKNLEEYLDKTLQDQRVGGFHFSGREEGTVNDLKVRMYEITVDKLVTGERKVYGWEFEAEDCYYGLVVQIFAKDERRLRPEIFKSFSSFKVFPRTGSLPNTARTGEDIVIADSGEVDANKELDPEELKKRREEAAERAIARAKENLPKGWNVMDGRNFTAVTHVDGKYTKEVILHCEALRAWLEENLGYIGTGYAGKVLIRICDGNDEYSAYQQSRGWSSEAPEVVTFKDKEGWLDWHWETLNRQVYRIWMKDKNQRLLWGLPQWIQWGLADMVERAKSKNGRIDFKADTWDSVEMKTLRRADNLLKPKDFFTLKSDELWGDNRNWIQTQFFIDFLMNGPASRSGKYRNVFSDYIKNIIFLLDMESLQDPGGSDPKAPQSEEEEERMFRERQNAWRERERETLDKLLEKTFGGWSDRDWAAFDALYRNFLK